jgi:alkanesulfonate monooxygenase SsuD/methylene tetrahydromethanopterin reductase-like flavin-dependent oxidoreductase (luciferase family)
VVDARGEPFAPGSVSIRLYPHTDLQAGAMLNELVVQAAMALELGFDGVMVSEHHGGMAGYLPQPLQTAAIVLEHAPAGWVAAAPLLLPLRPTAVVAEEVAWLASRHHGRVGLGVAAGARDVDYSVAGISAADAVDRFKAELPRLVAMLRGEELGALDGDPALAACRQHPVPVLSAAMSVTAARRAARAGIGLLLDGISAPGRISSLTDAYRAAGGTCPAVLVRRVWIGSVQRHLVEAQRAVYEGISGAPFGDDQTVAATEPSEVAEQLRAVQVEAGADALNLRVHLPGMTPQDVRGQLEALAASVVPALKERSHA